MRTHNQAFGKALREFRKNRCLTQETLAFEAGLDRTYISVLELGRRSPTIDTLISLCEVLGISLVELAVRAQDLDESQNDRNDHGPGP
ncbi:helix-turn-helix domain-containing protein [Pseudomonas sp. GXZC]|uniref:helix-turn-helix domain-containing protein n=1 Tax=Pseudomonas sp. GXZC TaxID=3003351 RepID=UPI0022AB122A|nr:helix-turn-helix transcriptional regulator [Pseudomonas sp. GXZC]WAT32290.1 helix-turn-helix transcriptional regulator [Pseudomonas sp. GXZC]